MARKSRARSTRKNKFQEKEAYWMIAENFDINRSDMQGLARKLRSEKTNIEHKTIKIQPRGLNQKLYVEKLQDPATHITFGIGPAGSGKTMLATQVAVKMLIDKKIDKIVITRPNEDVDNKGIGFLPGGITEKMNPFMLPILDVFADVFSQKEISDMIKEKVIEICPIAFIRGRTFKRAFVLVDEAQGTTQNSLMAILTRIGEDSKMAVTGDLAQSDRSGSNGLQDFLYRMSNKTVPGIEIIEFNKGDILRHPIIQEILTLYGQE